jgi:hypothetical protein
VKTAGEIVIGRYVTCSAGRRSTDHPQIKTQQREADINPYLPATCPRLLWRIVESGWDLLGYEHGRTADFSPDSPDLPRVVTALAALARTLCPDIALNALTSDGPPTSARTPSRYSTATTSSTPTWPRTTS